MSKELWRATFERFRERFHAAADEHGQLTCVLLQVGPGHVKTFRGLHPQGKGLTLVLLEVDPGDWRADCFKETPRHPLSKKVELIEGGSGIYRDMGELELSTWRTVYFIGQQQAASEFLRLSRDAGRALKNSDIPALRVIPRESLGSRQHQWIWVLFDVAWRKFPGTPLEADKTLCCGTTTFPYERPVAGTAHRTIWDGLYKSDRWGKYPPDCFRSELKDVFAASA